VDILERLADLIRPALGWKAGTGARPDGAFDGNAFLVTPSMMSILGATGEDMEEILKGLGYRGETKPEAEIKTRLETLDAAAQAQPEETKTAEAAATDTPGETTPEAVAEAQDEQPQDVAVEAAPATEPEPA